MDNVKLDKETWDIIQRLKETKLDSTICLNGRETEKILDYIGVLVREIERSTEGKQ